MTEKKVHWRELFIPNTKLDIGHGWYVISTSEAWYIGREYLHKKKALNTAELRFTSIFSLIDYISEMQLRLQGHQSFTSLLEQIIAFKEELRQMRTMLELKDSDKR